MPEKTKVTNARYHQIAVDLASKIADGQYKVGDKIFARSHIASQYGVSSETARRALCILSDLNIVDMTKGSGVIILSIEKAADFKAQYEDYNSIRQLKREILHSLKKQSEEMECVNQYISKLIDKTERLRSINPFAPYEIEITEYTPHLNKTSSEVNFWHHTQSTIVAIKRKDTIIMSPGPFATFQLDDIFYCIGDEASYERVMNFLYPPVSQ